ncbi:LOW QUALITY PROTEIN: ubiquitin-like protein 4B [Rhynchonycteris naso]
MFLTVKLLLGRRCSVKVGQDSVATLKKLVLEQLQVPAGRHLPFHGQPLADDKNLSAYCIGPNTSIHVIMHPLDKTIPKEVLLPQPLWHQLDRVLAKHFGPQDAKAVLRLLRQEYEARLQRMGLGHLEQLAQELLAEEPPVGLMPDAAPHYVTTATTTVIIIVITAARVCKYQVLAVCQGPGPVARGLKGLPPWQPDPSFCPPPPPASALRALLAAPKPCIDAGPRVSQACVTAPRRQGGLSESEGTVRAALHPAPFRSAEPA